LTGLLFVIAVEIPGEFPEYSGERDPSTANQLRVREADSSLRMTERMTSAEKPVQARRFIVRGRVQGVGFRWFVEREAHMLGIAGWVRNNHDGSVEVLAQGTRDQLSGLHGRLREGPRAARVDAVEVSDQQPVAGLSSFRIEGAW
jgi:acylphosphatase